MRSVAEKYSCKRVAAITYALRVGGEYADITIREWPGGGSICIQSSFGSYANTWRAIGEGPFRKFLCGLKDMGYFFSKCMGDNYLEFDCEATVKEIKQDIIQCRRDGEVGIDDAREIWDSLPDHGLATSLYAEMGSYDFDELVNKIYGGDAVDFPHITRVKCDCRNFWEQIWPCACEIWLKELATDNEDTPITFASMEELESRFAGLNENVALQSKPCPICGQHGHIGDCEGD